MPLLQVYVTDDTMESLKAAAREDNMGRTVEQLAEATVEEAALRARLEREARP